MITVATARLTSLAAQFTHPALSQAAAELNAFRSILPSFNPRFYVIDVGRFELSEFLPIGVITLLALPSAESQFYIRHLAAALLMGNSVLLAPLTDVQKTIADRMRRARPHHVRIAAMIRGLDRSHSMTGL